MVKKTIIETLAGMVQRGFDETHSKMATKEDLRHLATKEDLGLLRNELHETRETLTQAIKDLEMRFSA